ncbi:hypothetical protein OJAV_G00133250 [Oryzias javanicus]|uniref:Zinc finger protein 865 n=1 Tax=Oryzias javanicus TaxID=123683 RepID=A0A437CQT4_ORYJA|nr:hypothetical protein OJAV_G00133250 [Oryzias javanicus]
MKLILDTLLKAAADIWGFSGEETGNTKLKSGFDATAQMLSRETGRKICSVFSQMSSLLLSENSTLKARLERLEAELQSVTKNVEDARRWRENVLSGCPVLFQRSGLLLRLKPFGRLMRRADAQRRDEEPSSAAQMDGLDEAVKDCDVPNVTQEVVIRSNRKLLKRHTDARREQRPFACEQCPRRFRDSVTFENHRLRHQERIHASFACPLCAKTFRSRSSLKKHQLVHTDARPFVCGVCQKGFKTKYNLHAHEASHAAKTVTPQTACEPSHTCATCGKAFTRRRSLQSHQAVHRGKTFTCEVCGTGFSLRNNLRRHKRLHTGEKPHACKVCGRSFMHVNTLKAHMLLHGERKAFMCDLCGKTFLFNCQLKKHQRTHEEKQVTKGRSQQRGNRRVIYRQDQTTTDMTPFTCATCQKSFESAESLRRHQLIHSKSPQYNCDKCGKSFRYKATYQYHQRVHSGERPFACDVCRKTFIIRQALKSHMLQHSGEKPHKCTHCDKTFRIYTNLLRHLRVHTGEKPYECEVCGTRFRQLGHVKFHMQVHTGSKPHSCSSCGRSFSDSRLLKRHKCRRSVPLSGDV